MPAPERLTQSLADRYRIERELGRGGMATVYLADDLKHGRQVAIKVLRPELAMALGAERFLREIATTANLRHPHILPLYDSGEAAGFLYYVMPLVEGESLRDRLTRQKQLPLNTSLSLEVPSEDEFSDWNMSDILHTDSTTDPEELVLQREDSIAIQEMLQQLLSDFEWRVLAGYQLGKSYREILLHYYSAARLERLY